MKKYLKYATTFKPKLNKESRKYLNDYFVKIKSIDNYDDEVIPLDARALNSLIRLSGAIAKLKLKKQKILLIDKEFKNYINVQEEKLKQQYGGTKIYTPKGVEIKNKPKVGRESVYRVMGDNEGGNYFAQFRGSLFITKRW